MNEIKTARYFVDITQLSMHKAVEALLLDPNDPCLLKELSESEFFLIEELRLAKLKIKDQYEVKDMTRAYTRSSREKDPRHIPTILADGRRNPKKPYRKDQRENAYRKAKRNRKARREGRVSRRYVSDYDYTIIETSAPVYIGIDKKAPRPVFGKVTRTGKMGAPRAPKPGKVRNRSKWGAIPGRNYGRTSEPSGRSSSGSLRK